MQKLTVQEKAEQSPEMRDVYRRIRTNIEFIGMENRVICMTSCTANDGKTSVSFNLARSFADNGKKVLFIDTDMRNSRLDRRLDIPKNLCGLSHYLAGKNSESEIVYDTNIEHFYIIPAGYFPTNPTELLSREAFSTLIQKMKEVFDYVIIDTSPLGIVVDAAIVAKVADASILVMTPDVNRRKSAQFVKNQLVSANPNFLGVIMNRVEIDRKHRSYGYSYGYGYGCSYGEEDDE